MTMLLTDWIDTTIGVLSRGGDDEFLPTVADPTTRQIRTLRGIPKDVPSTLALQDWIGQLGLPEYFFAVAETERKVVVGHIGTRAINFAAITSEGNCWSSSECDRPVWWLPSQ